MAEDVVEKAAMPQTDLSPDVDIGMEPDIGSDTDLEFDAYSPWPVWMSVSGLYAKKMLFPTKPRYPNLPRPRYNMKARMELRLDVDGRYPQMTASGLIVPLWFTKSTHWIADLKRTAKNRWEGKIWYVDGDRRLFTFDSIEIVAKHRFYRDKYAELTFHGHRGTSGPYRLAYVSPYFHSVEFEYDVVQGSDSVTRYDTHAHPNRPADLPGETLTIQKVYRRAGFRTSKSEDDETIPITLAGDNEWDNLELHNAMQMYWSRFANVAQWSLWTLFAGTHRNGYGGIMFDDIGAHHRQGAAVFTDNSGFDADPGDPAPNAFRDRYIFWCACHEMGHCFNLAHSFQKEYPYQGNPWCGRLQDEPEALSFMNYPSHYPLGYWNASGEEDFFANFRWRFSDQELLFLRHAPARFVQMGNADWFDDHGFKYANTATRPELSLELRVNRETPLFEFLETIAIEFKLANASREPQIVDTSLIKSLDQTVLIIKKEGRPARQFIPFMAADIPTQKKVLNPKEAVYEAHLISAGLNGWDLAEPGIYAIQAVLKLPSGEDIVSNTLQLRVVPPKAYDEELVAQDYFSGDVGRVLVFEGSTVLHAANDVLRELVDRFPRHRASVLAQYALSNPVVRNLKELHFPDEIDPTVPLGEQGVGFKMNEADYEGAKNALEGALNKKVNAAADALGHIRYREFVQNYANSAALAGDTQTADTLIKRLLSTLKKRKVLPKVLDEIKSFGRALQK